MVGVGQRQAIKEGQEATQAMQGQGNTPGMGNHGVGADGKVRVCPHTARMDSWSYGNINEKSLSEIWNNRDKSKIDKDYIYENCRFKKQNEILFGLDHISHKEMI